MPEATTQSAPKGRAASFNPENRFDRLRIEYDPEVMEAEGLPPVKTEFFLDHSQEILAKNTSPDVPFTYSINPYRGCEHGCIYCYARPTHEYFGLSAGLDFESKIFVKMKAAELLEKSFRSVKWQPEFVAFSGNTDCYQAIERKLELTRDCLKVFLKFRNPVGIITKSSLITRDLDLLQELARLNLVSAIVSITTLDPELARKMEPRAAAPEKRLKMIEQLAGAGIPTGVNVAPIIPGLTDSEVPAILRESATRGATQAAYILLRLPYAVKELFTNWLQQNFPLRHRKVMNAIQDTRNGQLTDPRFGSRMRGEGVRAKAIARLFKVSCDRYGFNREKRELSTAHFRRSETVQGELFAE